MSLSWIEAIRVIAHVLQILIAYNPSTGKIQTPPTE
jgi:hypothetical protein